MPIAATPFEQEVVAEATKLTLEPTVEPLDGLLTVTPAKAAVAVIKSTRIAVESCSSFFIYRLLSGWNLLAGLRGLGRAKASPDEAGNPGIELGRWDAHIDDWAEAELAERSVHSIQASRESQKENAVR